MEKLDAVKKAKIKSLKVKKEVVVWFDDRKREFNFGIASKIPEEYPVDIVVCYVNGIETYRNYNYSNLW